jgi:hypothetical protein
MMVTNLRSFMDEEGGLATQLRAQSYVFGFRFFFASASLSPLVSEDKD